MSGREGTYHRKFGHLMGAGGGGRGSGGVVISVGSRRGPSLVVPVGLAVIILCRSPSVVKQLLFLLLSWPDPSRDRGDCMNDPGMTVIKF